MERALDITEVKDGTSVRYHGSEKWNERIKEGTDWTIEARLERSKHGRESRIKHETEDGTIEVRRRKMGGSNSRKRTIARSEDGQKKNLEKKIKKNMAMDKMKKQREKLNKMNLEQTRRVGPLGKPGGFYHLFNT